MAKQVVRRAVLLAASVGLLGTAAGCSSASHVTAVHEGASTTTEPPLVVPTTTLPAAGSSAPGTTAVPPTATLPASPSGSSSLKSANLRLSDLPSGWAAAKGGEPGVALGGASTHDLVDCLGRGSDAREVWSDEKSPVYDDGGLSAESDVSFVTPGSELGQELQAMDTEKGLGCLEVASSSALGAYGPASSSHAHLIAPPSGDYDAKLAFEISGVAHDKKSFTTDLYLLVTGGAELAVSFTGVGAAPSASLEQSVLERELQRFPTSGE